MPFVLTRSPAARFVLMALLCSLVLVGCRRPDKTLHLGLNPWPGYEFLFLAHEKGLFRSAGVDVRLVEFSSLSDCRRAFERGQLDGMASTLVEVLQARDRGIRVPRIIDVLDHSNGGDVVVARPEIRSMADLRGKRVGVELDSLGVYVLSRALGRSGLKLADVRTFSMDQVSMADELQRGELDAVVTYAPASVRLLRGGQYRAVFSTAEIPNEVLDVLAVDDRVLEDDPELVRRLVEAIRRAFEYWKEYPEEAHRIMAKRENVPADEFADSLANGIRIVPPEQQRGFLEAGGFTEQAAEEVERVLFESGHIQKRGLVKHLVAESTVLGWAPE